MKKMIALLFLISTLTLSGFTGAFATQGYKPGDVLLQEETTETPTETPTPTDTPEPTNTPFPTSTNTPETLYVVITATENASYERPLLSLKNYTYDSADTYAGGGFSLKSTIKNVGQQDAYNIIISYSSNDLIPGSNGGVNIVNHLDAGDGINRTQYFAVSDDINSSPATITMQVDYKNSKGSSYSQSFQISIVISGYGYKTPTPNGRPQMIVDNYESSVDPLVPGSSFILTMSLKNSSFLTAYHTKLLIASSSDSDSTVDDNFLPLGSSNIQVLGNVTGQQTIQFQQAFVVNSDITPGVYPLSLTFSYNDEDGNDYTDNQIITLLVNLVPTIEISFYEEPDTFTVGTASTLPIQVVNLGSDSVLLGNISITADTATLSNNKTFIGTLESGGSFTIDTDITPEQSGEIPVTITVNYQDNFNKSQVATQVLTITVEGQAQMGPGGAGQMTGTQQSTPDQAAGQQAGRGQMTGIASTNFWNILLRFIRGMIGFDSSASNGRTGGSPMMMSATQAESGSE